MTPENTITKPRAHGYEIRNCRTCAAESQRRARQRAKAEGRSLKRPPLEPGDERHGTASAYMNHGCRCDQCRAGNADYMREYRRARSGIGIGRHLAG
jgi:hypothetical protein